MIDPGPMGPLVYILMCTLLEMEQRKVRKISCEQNVYLSWSTSEIRMRLGLSNMFKPSRNYLTDHSKMALLLDFFMICVSSLSVMLSPLFVAAMQSPA